jgi:hypothetical protein
LRHTDDAVVRFRFPARPLIHGCHPIAAIPAADTHRKAAACQRSCVAVPQP